MENILVILYPKYYNFSFDTMNVKVSLLNGSYVSPGLNVLMPLISYLYFIHEEIDSK